MKEYEKILKALANRRRLEILKHLKDKGRATVGELAEKIKLSFKSTSRHLSILSAINIVDKDQLGLSMIYFINPKLSLIATLIIKQL
ncbi:MAG TPA: metalloregulator ArsR/SmtB family transcription factor [Candidatus Paceibacterota bacterium]